MKKTFIQCFNAPLELVLKARSARWDEIEKIPDLNGCNILFRREDDEVIYIERESSAKINIPPALQKYVSPDMLKWIEHSTWHKASNIHEWRIAPGTRGNYLDARGRTIYEEIEDGGELKTRRTLEMTLKLRIPVLGPLAEEAVFEAFKRNFDKDYDAICARIGNGALQHMAPASQDR